RFRHPSGGEVPAAVLHLTREIVSPAGERRVVPAVFSYWFVGRDRVATSTAGRMWASALNRLRLQPDRWAYVVAQTVVLPGETEADALARVQLVLDGTLAVFQPTRRNRTQEGLNFE
ncbi:MAG TPA: hypothetical protein VHF69_14015, partial [Candidatus Synoicihabitans sp.]|nr:hypothetical protein [Candidatus Synoicihabitans sp.]